MLILSLDDFYSHLGKDVDLYTQDAEDEDLVCRRDRAIQFSKDAYTYMMEDLKIKDEFLRDLNYYPLDIEFHDIVDSCVLGDRYDLKKIYTKIRHLVFNV